MGLEILQALSGGGAVIACIAVVVLFHQKEIKTLDALKAISADFNKEVAATRQARSDQHEMMMAHAANAQRLYQESVREVLAEHIVVTRDCAAAYRALDATLRAVEVTLRDVLAASHGPHRPQGPDAERAARS